MPKTENLQQARYFISPNSEDKVSNKVPYYNHNTSAAWLVLVIRQNDPAAAYAKNKESLQWNPTPMIIENDCLNISYQGGKANFAKMCKLTMKANEVYYLGATSPGDWIVVWIADHQNHIDNIRLKIGSNKKSDIQFLNNWDSGLKFVGRVVGVGDSQVVQAKGNKTVTQSITCQSFMEMANSIYFTTATRTILSRQNGTTDAEGNKKAGKDEQDIREINLIGPIDKALGKNNYDRFKQFFPDSEAGRTPDTLIAQIFTANMGIEKDYLQGKLAGKTNLRPSFGAGIKVPKLLSQIIGTGKETHLWELYNVYAGLQRYGRTATGANGDSVKPWKLMSPITKTFGFEENPEKKVFFDSRYPCKGVILYYPALWENKDLWSFMRTYLFSALNEMYTVTRCNEFNQIKPSLVIREKPFGTGLFDNLKNGTTAPVEQITRKKIEKDTDATKRFTKEFPDRKLARAQYHSHPRWVIDSSMIHSVNISTSESKRINFVQIYSNSYLLKRIYPRAEEGDLRAIQFAAGNYVVDDSDIERNGLRADTIETPFIDLTEGELSTVEWCRIRADHLFNGHLKLSGTITIRGIQEPIVEGDNLQVGFKYAKTKNGNLVPNYNTGLVFHIENVSHQCSIAANGSKTFRTVLSVSNGILAASLSKGTDIPQYAYDIGSSRRVWEQFLGYLPGVTDIQKTLHNDRHRLTGEKKDKPKNE